MNAPFERTYSSVCDAIDNFEIGADGHGQAAEDEGGQARTARARIVAEHIPPPSRERPFWLFGVDTTPNPRPVPTEPEAISAFLEPFGHSRAQASNPVL